MEKEAVIEIDGSRVVGNAEGGVHSFKGLPYAAPPVGALRWREPQPRSLPDTYEATEFRSDCMQIPFESIVATPIETMPSEDCLYLNVWRPQPAQEKKAYPVVVWIHGGGFVNGGSSQSIYDGTAMAQGGVVFVTFNYRLGRFGFFTHPALTAAAEGRLGNYGLMDQIAALSWIKDNIAAFGGDPKNVTIVGESAGGVSVLNLMVSPAARGLFHRAVVMSGGGRIIQGFGGRHISEERNGVASAEQIGVTFARAVGINGEGKAALKALRELPAEIVLGSLNLRTLFAQDPLAPQFSGGPFIDGAIITGEVEDLVGGESAFSGPLMIGTTGADMGFELAPTKALLFATFGQHNNAAEAAYDPGGGTDLQTLRDRIGADRMMHEPARYVARQHSASGASAYLYRFHYVAESVRDEWGGARHASEIPYFLATVRARYGGETTQLDLSIERVTNAYVLNFARSGNPNGAGQAQWPSFKVTMQEVLLRFTDQGEAIAGADPWADRLDVVEAARRGREVQ
ncbi:carboxylesterase [Marinicaulis flavus]|uniref:Carboxylic ester hydrolase n=2 Tax=Hyphococcus luteus TaxID=2058213 RepID=A0A2S7K2E9_9PROT|nr:carboxylesterase [Marinicaulis flavus]